MSFITRSELLNHRNNFNARQLNEMVNRPRRKPYREPGGIYGIEPINVFLSHSHYDKDLIEPARLFLISQGVNVYVDWKDDSMPEVTSPETARLIKEKIEACERFVVLASKNALNSKWVPWELGFADKAKGVSKIAILPVAENNGDWSGSEYMGIYPRIEYHSNKGNTRKDWAVINLPKNKWLSDWL